MSQRIKVKVLHFENHLPDYTPVTAKEILAENQVSYSIESYWLNLDT